MSRLRSHLSPRPILLLFVLTLGVSLFAFAAASTTPTTQTQTELGTTDQQTAVRTSRETSLSPLHMRPHSSRSAPGSSTSSFTRTRNLTASAPSTMR